MTDPAFDGHQAGDFTAMTPDERLDDLSRKIALVLELRRSRASLEAAESSLGQGQRDQTT